MDSDLCRDLDREPSVSTSRGPAFDRLMPLLGRLVLSPFSLAEVAAHVTTGQAILVGLGALFFMNCAFWGIAGASVAEPFPTLTDYFKDVIETAPLIGAVMTIFAGFVLLSCSHLAASYCRRPESALRIFLLGPAAVLVPFSAWMVFGTLALIADPGFGLTRSQKPDWIQSSLIDALGSWVGLWGVFAILVLIYVVAFARVREISWRRFAIRTLCALTGVAFCFVLLDIGLPHDSPSTFWPSRGTQYASGYSEAAFQDVQPGMTADEVDALVGPPIRRRTGGDGTVYLDYTARRERWWGAFGYFLRRIHLTNGRVNHIERDFTFNEVLP